MMLTAYLIALGIGGTLLLASLFLGDQDADSDADADADADGDGDGGDLGAALAWLPLGSVRFWTFFLAFGGVTGAIFTLFGLASTAPTAVAAAGVGWATGAAAVTVIRRLRGRDTTSGLEARDYIGCSGTVVVPIARGRTGKVALDVKGRRVTLLADTEDEGRYELRAAVVVYEVTDDGRAMVTRAERLTA